MRRVRRSAGGFGRRARRRLDRWMGGELTPLRAALCIGLIALSAFVFVWPHLELVKLGYESARLEARRDQLTQERRTLQIEVATLRQLDRIEAIAREKLGMIFPKPDQVVYVQVTAR